MPEYETKKTFAENLSRLLERNNITQIELAKRMQVAASTVSSWCSGEKMPRMDKVEMLAKYFGCLISDLIEEEKNSPQKSELSDKKKEFIQKIEKMSDAQIERLEQILALVEKTDV